MKKFWSILFSAALVLGAAACGDDDNDTSAGDNNGGNGGNPSAFSCMITVTPGETDAKVSVTVSDAEKTYKLWVVKMDDYAEEVPADAVACTGNVTDQLFEGLTPDTDYYAVAWEESMGYKSKDFFTDKASASSFASLQGANYYVIQLDAQSREVIKGQTVADLGCDNLTTFFDWWNGGAFEARDSSGPNVYGVVDGWINLGIKPIEAAGWWFGGCFRLINPTENEIGEGEGKITQEAYDTAKARRAKLADITADYVLHLAMRSASAGDYNVSVFGGQGVVIGDENAKYGFAHDNQWHEIEIPMSEFMAGTDFTFDNVNMCAFTQGPEGSIWPTELNIDAAFFYQPAK